MRETRIIINKENWNHATVEEYNHTKYLGTQGLRSLKIDISILNILVWKGLFNVGICHMLSYNLFQVLIKQREKGRENDKIEYIKYTSTNTAGLLHPVLLSKQH